MRMNLVSLGLVFGLAGLVSGCAAQLNATKLDSEIPGGAKVTLLNAHDLGPSFHGRSAELMLRVTNESSTPLTVNSQYIYLATRLGMRWCKPASFNPHLPTPDAIRTILPNASDDVVVRCRIDGMQNHDEIKIGLSQAFYNAAPIALPLLSLLVE